jgi:2-C-methyl-D-erythritol 4-phosphate cytidylyltransferase
MRVERPAPDAFTAEFESEQEVRDEHRTNLAFGALKLPTAESIARESVLRTTLRGPWGGEIAVKTRVVASLPDGIALAVEENPDEILARLLARPEAGAASEVAESDETSSDDEPAQRRRQSVWDRVRQLPQIEKILLAAKADRTERALLLQDNDPRVLLSILRNPRLTLDEVIRLAKSSFLTYQIADVIIQTAQWMANVDVRRALIYNAKTPQAFSLRILPTLSDADVRAIAKAGTSAALKQAALRRLQK